MRLNHRLLPMVDYHKAKQLLWDPRDIDCDQDRRDRATAFPFNSTWPR